MLPEPVKTWFEAISEGWQWIAGFVLAFLAVWRGTRKTAEKGYSVFTVVKRFTDTGAALNTLSETMQKGFDELRSEQIYINAKLEVLSDGHITPTFRADETGNFIDVNEAFCQLFHKSLDELTGDGWTAIFHREDRSESLSAWDRAISRQTNFSQIFRVKTAGSITKNVKMRARPIFDGKGNLKEFVGSISLFELDEEIHLTGDYPGLKN